MVELTTLGVVELVDDTGNEIRSVLAQPKRLALLVYLASLRPAGPQRREPLLHLFWPDQEAERAREALSQALRFLRNALGQDVLVRRGADEIAVDRTRLACDVVAFRAAVDAGMVDEAMSLYRGDYLQGLSFDQPKGFEDWVGRERTALREMAAQCARQIADRHEEGGLLTLAVLWSRKAHELLPDDERTLRRLLVLHERAGDRSGALQAYHAFARRLQREYGCEPSPETTAVYERLRTANGAQPERNPFTQSPPPEDTQATPAVPPPPPKSGATGSFTQRYQVERQIGAGGMALVYLAHDLKHHREVAIKVLRPEVSAGLARDRFDREIRIASGLQHPNIVPLFDSGEHEGQLYFVMPYVKGPTLRERLNQQGRLAVGEVLHLLRELADALAYAHELGVVHRDIKPENIMLIGDRAVLTDFGIARAAHAAWIHAGTDHQTLTQRGVSLGTPAYMAPEQVAGGQDIDSRADLYAMGILAYEMLMGRPPFDYLTPQQVLVAHISETPRPIAELVPGLPPALAELVMRCLKKSPDDRPASAQEVLRLLESTNPSPRDFLFSIRRALSSARARRTTQLLALSALGAAAAFVAVPDSGGSSVPTVESTLDTTRLAVLPVEQQDTARARTIDDLVYEALSRWSGFVLVDQFQVTDAIIRLRALRSKDDAAAVAATVGAGRYIRLRATPFGDSTRVYAALYDARPDRQLHHESETIPNDVTRAGTAYASLVRRLLLRGAGSDSTPVEVGTQRHLPALQAYLQAQNALTEWNLSAADSSFQTAVAFDPSFARASLWLAQVRAWRGLAASSWSSLAQRAASATDLSEHDRTLAQALVFLASGKYDAACQAYDDLRRRNDRDFGAWFGLGQCRSMDKTVVRDPSSPSHWRMRSSYRRALEAYIKAFEILPSVYTGYTHDSFYELRGLLLLTTDLVSAYGSGVDSMIFQARPAWLGDSLALIPYPWRAVAAGNQAAIPPGFTTAIARQRGEFRKLAAGWSAAFPEGAGPKQAVAIALELLEDPSAIDTLRLARRLARDSTHARQLASAEALLRMKFAIPTPLAGLRTARALADSLLEIRWSTSAEAKTLAPVAAITGRCELTERLNRRVEPDLGGLNVPTDLVREAQVLATSAALGCGDEGAKNAVSDLSESIARARRKGRTDIQGWAELAILYRPLLLSATPDSLITERLGSVGDDLLLNAARALSRRDTNSVRRLLSAFRSQWNDALGAPTPDIVFPGARMLVSVGDTTEAIEWLDRTLKGIRSNDPSALLDPVEAGAYVRSMVLRADLAAGRGDRAQARRWGSAVAILWSRADPQLQPVVQRMTRFANQ